MKLQNKSLYQLFLIGTASVLFFFCAGDDGGPPAVTIDLSGTQALFIVSRTSLPSASALATTPEEESLGPLRKILSGGAIKPVILKERKSGNLNVSPSNIFIGPEGKVYITFAGGGVRMNQKVCYLIRGTSDRAADCIGPQELGRGVNGSPYNPFVNPFTSPDSSMGTYFDSRNNFYFSDNGGETPIRTRIKMLSPEGIASDQLSYPYKEVKIDQFAVTADGTVFFTGRTEAIGQRFFRKTKSSGETFNLPIESSESDFMVTSGGDLFVGHSPVIHLAESSGQVTSTTISLPPLALAASDAALELKTDSGGGNKGYLEDAAKGVYTVSLGRIFRIHPGIPAAVTPSGHKVTLAKTGDNLLYYAGTDSKKKNIFRRVDLTDKTFPETDLLTDLKGKRADMEVYRFQVRSNGNVLFGGLRLSDNQLILGEIDGKTLEMTVKATTTTRIDDLVLVAE